MTLRLLAAVTLGLAATSLAGCRPGPSQGHVGRPTGLASTRGAPATFPELGLRQLIQPGIQFQEATLRRGSMPMRVWYYQPEQASGKLALVLVPPAGSTLFGGMALSEGDRREHYPYARAGFAVGNRG